MMEGRNVIVGQRIVENFYQTTLSDNFVFCYVLCVYVHVVFCFVSQLRRTFSNSNLQYTAACLSSIVPRYRFSLRIGRHYAPYTGKYHRIAEQVEVVNLFVSLRRETIEHHFEYSMEAYEEDSDPGFQDSERMTESQKI